ncbi:hypothetical protein V3589_11395 [Sinorhizobium fredii]|uniref:hypothetical protein n=1 Tax=Rhizobium fredii TaxID=380 RepID=UPI00309669EA
MRMKDKRAASDALMTRLASLPKSDETLLATFCPPEWEDIRCWWDEAVDEARKLTGRTSLAVVRDK